MPKIVRKLNPFFEKKMRGRSRVKSLLRSEKRLAYRAARPHQPAKCGPTYGSRKIRVAIFEKYVAVSKTWNHNAYGAGIELEKLEQGEIMN
jgi:hypothetical protein